MKIPSFPRFLAETPKATDPQTDLKRLRALNRAQRITKAEADHLRGYMRGLHYSDEQIDDHFARNFEVMP
jgi:hypothetical protein